MTLQHFKALDPCVQCYFHAFPLFLRKFREFSQLQHTTRISSLFSSASIGSLLPYTQSTYRNAHYLRNTHTSSPTLNGSRKAVSLTIG